MLRKTIASLIVLTGLTAPGQATPIDVYHTGTFSGGSDPAWSIAQAGDPFEIHLSFDTNAFSVTGSGGMPTYYTYNEYTGVATWSGTIGTTNFSWTGSTMMTVQDGLSFPDTVYASVPYGAHLFGPTTEDYLSIGFEGVDGSIFSGTGVANFGFVGLLDTSYTNASSGSSGSAFLNGPSSAYSVVPEASLSHFLRQL